MVASRCLDSADLNVVINMAMNDEKDDNIDVNNEEVVNDVEEGEISDDSVEEISAEDFKQQQESPKKVTKESNKVSNKSDFVDNSTAAPRYWTMQDLVKYPALTSKLYNMAWANAVRNKPLNLFVVKDDKGRSNSAMVAGGKEVEKIVIDDSGDEMDVEKEEGELEEGEIDLDSEEPVASESVSEASSSNADGREDQLRKGDMELESIRVALESVTASKAEESIEEVCQCIRNAVENLHELMVKRTVSKTDSLIQLAFSAIRVVNSVLCGMDSNKKERNKEIFMRLLTSIKSCDPPLFSSEQMKELEVMLLSWGSFSILLSTAGGTEKQMEVDKAWLDGDFRSDARNAVKTLNVSVEALKPGLSSFRIRSGLPPLLDLHKDHDLDSLPSPTRDAPPPMPMYRSLPDGEESKILQSGLVNGGHDSGDLTMRPYETDVLKAVSSYQEKFSWNSFKVTDRLPSPTPSEDANTRDDESGGEVSSLPVSANNKTATPTTLGQPVVFPAPTLEKSDVQEPMGSSNAVPTVPGLNATMKAPRKLKDPRLQFAAPNKGALDLNQCPLPVVHKAPMAEPAVESASLKRQNIDEEYSGIAALKRQRNGFEQTFANRDSKSASSTTGCEGTKAVASSVPSREHANGNATIDPRKRDNGSLGSTTGRVVEAAPGTGGWLDDNGEFAPRLINRDHPVEHASAKPTDPRKLNNGSMGMNTSYGNPTVGISNSSGLAACSGNVQLPVQGSSAAASLPALLNDIAVNPTILINLLKMSQPQSSGAESRDGLNIATTSSLNSILGAVPAVNPLSNSAGLLQKPSGTLPVPCQNAPLGESGKIRIKPRDPRRALHVNATQKSGAPASNNQGTREGIYSQKLDGHSAVKALSSQSAAPPGVTHQFAKGLKNVADTIPSSQRASGSPNFHISSSQPAVNSGRVDTRPAVLRTKYQQAGAISGPEPQNSWGDVDHLVEGFDERQKAAIQRERARRIEEQKKMFAARKLCLVLDLDHTLLNSAKFSEIDPVHEEILRKKEEQDREKPQRHLFRFSHMGMWTKLRPGIWNFLERASQLFELHLYTMGNKIYATEMAKVLDPKGTLFNGRVISRGDDGDSIDGEDRAPKSKDLDGVLGMESAVVIIDDSVRVWPHHRANLIVVERYTYFPCSRRQFGLLGPSLLEIDHDERPEEGTLASSLAVIEKLHQSFFSNPCLDEVDVRSILADVQRKILAGCCIVFSRVFPVGEAAPELHPLWQTAQQFGAKCTTQIGDEVTHVVANALGTDKVNWALSTGRYVVNPGWVEASALLYRRANEADFAIKP